MPRKGNQVRARRRHGRRATPSPVQTSRRGPDHLADPLTSHTLSDSLGTSAPIQRKRGGARSPQQTKRSFAANKTTKPVLDDFRFLHQRRSIGPGRLEDVYATTFDLGGAFSVKYNVHGLQTHEIHAHCEADGTVAKAHIKHSDNQYATGMSTDLEELQPSYVPPGEKARRSRKAEQELDQDGGARVETSVRRMRQFRSPADCASWGVTMSTVDIPKQFGRGSVQILQSYINTFVKSTGGNAVRQGATLALRKIRNAIDNRAASISNPSGETVWTFGHGVPDLYAKAP